MITNFKLWFEHQLSINSSKFKEKPLRLLQHTTWSSQADATKCEETFVSRTLIREMWCRTRFLQLRFVDKWTDNDYNNGFVNGYNWHCHSNQSGQSTLCCIVKQKGKTGGLLSGITNPTTLADTHMKLRITEAFQQITPTYSVST